MAKKSKVVKNLQRIELCKRYSKRRTDLLNKINDYHKMIDNLRSRYPERIFVVYSCFCWKLQFNRLEIE